MSLNKRQSLVASTIEAIENYVEANGSTGMISGLRLRELMGLEERIAHGKALAEHGVLSTPVKGVRMYRIPELLALRTSLDAEVPGWAGMPIEVLLPRRHRNNGGDLAGVYVIYNDTDPGYFKIGMSDSVVRRVKEFSTGARQPWRFKGVVLCPAQVGMTSKKLEGFVHGVAQDYRIDDGGGTEFFKFPPGMIDPFLRNMLTEHRLPVLLLNGETAEQLKAIL
jgi:T5orf172 domain